MVDSQDCKRLFDSYSAALFSLAENEHRSGKTWWDAPPCAGEAHNGGEACKGGRSGDSREQEGQWEINGTNS